MKNISKGAIRTIVIAAVISVLTIAVLITNIFIPVKYLSAYIIFSKDIRAQGTARVTYLDVGYGDCTLVELPDSKTMLIDGGNGRYKNQLTILKCLNKRGIKTIDYLICTSVKAEHCGGLTELIKYKNVTNIYVPYCIITSITDEYGKFISAAKSCGASLAYCEYGEGAAGDSWSFRFLSPSVHESEEDSSEYYLLNTDPTDTNIDNASAVVWLDCAGVQFLFLGDITSDIGDKLVQYNSVSALFDYEGKVLDVSQCDVIQIAKHGADCGTFEDLYKITQPSAAVISVGDNGIGAPAALSMAEAQAYVGDELFRTDRDGTVTVTAKDGQYTVKTGG